MSIAISCECGFSTGVKDEYASKRVRCPNCKAAIDVPALEEDLTTSFDGDEDPSAPDRDPIAERFGIPASPRVREAVEEPKRWEYKVLTQKDKWFTSKFDPEKLEAALNSYAAQGWRMRGMATASFPGFGGGREELIFVLER